MKIHVAISLEAKLHPKITSYDWFQDTFHQNTPIQQERGRTVGGNVWFAVNTKCEPKHDSNVKTVTLDYALNPVLNYIIQKKIIEDY